LFNQNGKQDKKQMQLFLSKLKAFVSHLILSALLIGGCLMVVVYIWFPGTLFETEKTWEALQILIPVDIVLGPILTFLVFKPGKKSLKADLSIIAGIQVAALLYGIWTVYSQRPVILTFNIHEFQVITAAEGIKPELSEDEFKNSSGRLITLTYPIPPQSKEEIAYFLTNRIAFEKQPSRMKSIVKYKDILSSASFNNRPDWLGTLSPNKKATLESKIKSENGVFYFKLRSSLGVYSIVGVDIEKEEIVEFISID